MKSSRCGDSACVEVTQFVPGSIMVRQSDQPERMLVFTADEWVAFIAGVKDGEFDLA